MSHRWKCFYDYLEVLICSSSHDKKANLVSGVESLEPLLGAESFSLRMHLAPAYHLFIKLNRAKFYS